MLHARVSAIGADRTFIGDRLPEIDASIFETITPQKTCDQITQPSGS
jgi:hypothetical protein